MHLDPCGVITLMSDFGMSDHFVGVMKGVILNINPNVEIVDITHSIPPQDVYGAAFLVDSTCRYFPAGTIHVVVVDPGVGSRRRAIVCQTETAYFVCPDNGVLSYVLDEDSAHRVVVLDNSTYWLSEVSNTFHGRDIFAPVAAHLSRGTSLSQFGHSANNVLRLPIQIPHVTKTVIVGSVIWIDRFGNLITNLTSDMLESFGMNDGFVIKAGKAEVYQLNCAYAESEKGECLAIIGSSGHLEISVNQESAARVLGLKRNNLIEIHKI